MDFLKLSIIRVVLQKVQKEDLSVKADDSLQCQPIILQIIDDMIDLCGVGGWRQIA